MILGLKALPVLGTPLPAGRRDHDPFYSAGHPGGALLFCTLVAVILPAGALMLAPELAPCLRPHLSRLQDIRMPTMPENADARRARDAAGEGAPSQPRRKQLCRTRRRRMPHPRRNRQRSPRPPGLKTQPENAAKPSSPAGNRARSRAEQTTAPRPQQRPRPFPNRCAK